MYFITAMTSKGHTRCVGYLTSLEKAIEVVRSNKCDIYEAGAYPYAVIENIEEGLYQHDLNPLWFTWNNEKKEYIGSDKPHFIEDYYVGFAIG